MALGWERPGRGLGLPVPGRCCQTGWRLGGRQAPGAGPSSRLYSVLNLHLCFCNGCLALSALSLDMTLRHRDCLLLWLQYLCPHTRTLCCTVVPLTLGVLGRTDKGGVGCCGADHLPLGHRWNGPHLIPVPMGPLVPLPPQAWTGVLPLSPTLLLVTGDERQPIGVCVGGNSKSGKSQMMFIFQICLYSHNSPDWGLAYSFTLSLERFP